MPVDAPGGEASTSSDPEEVDSDTPLIKVEVNEEDLSASCEIKTRKKRNRKVVANTNI